MEARRVILVFVKWPRPGHVKTRLATAIGNEVAAGIYRQLVEAVAAILTEAPTDEIRFLFDPPHRECEVRKWLSPLFSPTTTVTFHPQVSGDLGDRLATAFRDAFEIEGVIAAAIGTDCIEIDPSTFEQTWSALASGAADAVFGPARDGGYYLVGLRGIQPALFVDIPWSTEDTLPATLKRAEAASLRVTLLEQKRDIDTLADWQQTQ